MEETKPMTVPVALRRLMAYIMLLFVGASVVSVCALPAQYAYAEPTDDNDDDDDDGKDKDDDSSKITTSTTSSTSSSDTASSAKFSDIGSAATRYWQNAHAADIQDQNDTTSDDDDSDSALSGLTAWFAKLFGKTSSGSGTSGDSSGNNSMSVGELTKELGWTGSGLFLVFQSSDVDTAGSVVGLFSSNSSNSAQSVSYSSVGSIDAQLNMYTHYGRALSLLGLDHVETAATAAGSRILRVSMGGSMFIAYNICNFMTGVFQLAIAIMQGLNPFGWFASTWDAAKIQAGSGMSRDNLAGTALANIQGMVLKIYQPLYEMGFIVSAIVLCIGVGLSLMAFAKSDRSADRKRTVGGTIKDYVKRLLFLLIIFPLCGIAFTSMLNDLAKSNSESPFTSANDIVCSTFVDFESWATQKELALPKDVKITLHGVGEGTSIVAGDLDMTSTTPSRTVAKAINESVGYGKKKNAVDLITKYIDGSHISASTYESKWKNANLVNDSGQIPAKKIKRLVKSTQVDNWATKNKDMVNYKWIRGNSSNAGSGASTLTYSADNTTGGLSAMSMYAYLLTEFTDTQVTMYSASNTSSTLTLPEHVSVGVAGASSLQQALTMTNSTVMLLVIGVLSIFFAFGMATSIIGRGIKLLTSVPFALLGSFKAMAKVVTIGALMIIEVVGTTVVWALVVELFIDVNNIFESWLRQADIGSLAKSVMSNISGTVMVGAPSFGPFDVLDAIGQAGSSFVNSQFIQLANVVFLVLSLVFNVWFMFKMIKLRKSILKVMDEFAASIIDRFFSPAQADRDSSLRTSSGQQLASQGGTGSVVGGVAKQAAGSLVSGAGMAAGMAMTNKGMGAIAEKLGVGGTAEPARDVVGEDGAENRTVSSENDVMGIEGAEMQALPDGMDASAVDDARMVSGTDETSVSGASATQTVSADTAETDAALQSAMGNTSVAQDDAADAARRDVRAEQLKDTVAGGAKVVEGGVKVAAGYASGNAELMAEGAVDAADGVGKVATAKATADEKMAAVNQGQAAAGQKAMSASAQGASTSQAHAAASSVKIVSSADGKASGGSASAGSGDLSSTVSNSVSVAGDKVLGATDNAGASALGAAMPGVPSVVNQARETTSVSNTANRASMVDNSRRSAKTAKQAGTSARAAARAKQAGKRVGTGTSATPTRQVSRPTTRQTGATQTQQRTAAPSGPASWASMPAAAPMHVGTGAPSASVGGLDASKLADVAKAARKVKGA